MKINGIEVSFDLDNRKDYSRFEKAYHILQKKERKSQLTLDDMEIFLAGCLNQTEVSELLKDSKISTLTKVFVEFFDMVVDQYTEVIPIYTDAAKKITELDAKIEDIGTEKTNTLTEQNSIGGMK